MPGLLERIMGRKAEKQETAAEAYERLVQAEADGGADVDPEEAIAIFDAVGKSEEEFAADVQYVQNSREADAYRSELAKLQEEKGKLEARIAEKRQAVERAQADLESTMSELRPRLLEIDGVLSSAGGRLKQIMSRKPPVVRSPVVESPRPSPPLTEGDIAGKRSQLAHLEKELKGARGRLGALTAPGYPGAGEPAHAMNVRDLEARIAGSEREVARRRAELEAIDG